MSEQYSTRVEGPLGAMHSGPGDIHMYMDGQRPDSDKTAFRRIADDQLAWLRRVLVAPAGMGEARRRLADTSTVILDGEPGSGRVSVAKVLLRECHHGTGVLHELRPGEEGELPLRDPALVGAGDRMLLDLSAADTAQWADAHADLSALRKNVHEQRAHLVVVMPRERALDPDLQRYRVEIERPPDLNVFRRHLRMHGVSYEQYLRPDPTVAKFVHEQRSMRELADFADLVRRASEARPADGFAEWCVAARKARADRRKVIADLVAGLREGPQRALLISVAMLHGAHADVIHATTQLLLDTLQPPDDRIPILQRKDLAERLNEISADTGPDGHVRFKEVDYDTAVRAHFWDHMPDLRQHLGTWTAHSVGLRNPHLTQEIRDSLVAQLSEQYLRTGRGDDLTSLAERWSATPTSRVQLDAAIHALTCGLNDPAHGSILRHQIYEWCRHRQLKGEFPQVLVHVCANVIASNHPDQALIRLHHLARRERDSIRALQALCDLAGTSSRLRRRLLDRLAQSDLSPAQLRIFLPVCDPVPLTAPHDNSRALVEENGVQDSLTRCWCAAMGKLPRATWQPYAQSWIHTAADTEHRGDLLLDVLVGAASRCDNPRGATFAALYASARAAERTFPGEVELATATADRLVRKISAAQGLISPTNPPPTAAPGETAR